MVYSYHHHHLFKIIEVMWVALLAVILNNETIILVFTSIRHSSVHLFAHAKIAAWISMIVLLLVTIHRTDSVWPVFSNTYAKSHEMLSPTWAACWRTSGMKFKLTAPLTSFQVSTATSVWLLSVKHTYSFYRHIKLINWFSRFHWVPKQPNYDHINTLTSQLNA